MYNPEIGDEAQILMNKTDLSTQLSKFFEGESGQATAIDLNRSPSRPHHPVEKAKQGSLAGTAETHEAHRFTRLNPEVNRVERTGGPVVYRDAGEMKHLAQHTQFLGHLTNPFKLLIAGRDKPVSRKGRQ